MSPPRRTELPSENGIALEQNFQPRHVRSREMRNANRNDRADMERFGKRQQLKRNFGLLSIVGLTCTLMITWEGTLTTFQLALFNGGRAGAVYAYVFTWIGNILQVLVMAEMGSMVPLSGGQYNWVAVLAPHRWSRFLSYLTGWTTLIAWQAVTASAVLLSGSMIQGVLILNYGNDYRDNTQINWQLLLIMYAIIVFTLSVNTFLAKILPQIESMVLLVHVIGFFLILIPLLYMAPKTSAQKVFTTFHNGGEFSSQAISFFVGTYGPMFAFTGIDAASHVAEEIQNASTVIPQSMCISVLLNGILGLGMTIAILFCIPDLHRVLETPTSFPYIQIFYQATSSLKGTSAMTSPVIAAMMLAAIGCFVSASRMVWAFSRENGIPLARLFGSVNEKHQLPLYAIGLTAFISAALALLVLQSAETLNIVVSLVVAGFYTTFLIAAIVMLHKRLTTTNEKILWGPFRLGRAGVPTTIAAIMYSILGLFFSFWPTKAEVTVETMNWNVAVFGVIMIFSLVFWYLHGRKNYIGIIQETGSDANRALPFES